MSGRTHPFYNKTQANAWVIMAWMRWSIYDTIFSVFYLLTAISGIHHYNDSSARAGGVEVFDRLIDPLLAPLPSNSVNIFPRDSPSPTVTSLTSLLDSCVSRLDAIREYQKLIILVVFV